MNRTWLTGVSACPCGVCRARCASQGLPVLSGQAGRGWRHAPRSSIIRAHAARTRTRRWSAAFARSTNRSRVPSTPARVHQSPGRLSAVAAAAGEDRTTLIARWRRSPMALSPSTLCGRCAGCRRSKQRWTGRAAAIEQDPADRLHVQRADQEGSSSIGRPASARRYLSDEGATTLPSGRYESRGDEDRDGRR